MNDIRQIWAVINQNSIDIIFLLQIFDTSCIDIQESSLLLDILFIKKFISFLLKLKTDLETIASCWFDLVDYCLEICAFMTLAGLII